jgi:outer membrane lipoprotein SlyB
VVAINDVSMQGGGGSSGSGPGNGTMMGGLLGGLGGIAIGASGGRGIGGGLIGGVLGAVGGAIAGTIIDRHTSIGGGRGIEVTVQKDDGQTVTVAQRDDGDVQLGDRVQIVQGRDGVAKAVRDNGRQPDYQNGGQNGGYQNAGPAPQDYRQAGNSGGNYGPPPQDYRQGQNPQDYGPQPADYGQQPRYAPPQSSSRSGYGSFQGGGYSGGGYQSSGYQNGPQPQNDPRYGTLQ